MGVVAETADRVIVRYKVARWKRPTCCRCSGAKSDYTRALLAALPDNATGDRLPTIGEIFQRRRVRSGPMTPVLRRNIVAFAAGGLFKKEKTVHAVKGVNFKDR